MQKIATLGTGKWLSGTFRMHCQLLVSERLRQRDEIYISTEWLKMKIQIPWHCLWHKSTGETPSCEKIRCISIPQNSCGGGPTLPHWLFLLCVNLQLCETEPTTLRGGTWCICGIYGTIGSASFLMIPNGAPDGVGSICGHLGEALTLCFVFFF